MTAGSVPGPAATATPSNRLREAFAGVTWAFGDSKPLSPHLVHPYPARFIPEIPSTAISLISDIEGAVLDPFCGAGTTLVEAVRKGRPAIGVDLNPIATLISRVKLRKWESEDSRQLDHFVVGLRWAAQIGDAEELDRARDRIPRLDHWFGPEGQHALAGAVGFMKSIKDDVWRDRVALAISASVVRISRQDSDTRYAAVQKNMDSERAVKILTDSLVKVASQLRGFAPHHRDVPSTVHTADARDVGVLVPPSTVAAAIFSPPYPNAYEYWLYHKYRMYWLSFDPISVRTDEMGARPHYSGTGRADITTFRAQMLEVMHGIVRTLVDGGLCFAVVGDSRIKGETFDGAELFDGLAQAAGMEKVAGESRPIRASRKSFNLAVARATEEHVLLYRRS